MSTIVFCIDALFPRTKRNAIAVRPVLLSLNANSCTSNSFGSSHHDAFRRVIRRCLPPFFNLAISLSSTLPTHRAIYCGTEPTYSSARVTPTPDEEAQRQRAIEKLKEKLNSQRQ